jgi:hypothetical protein
VTGSNHRLSDLAGRPGDANTVLLTGTVCRLVTRCDAVRRISHDQLTHARSAAMQDHCPQTAPALQRRLAGAGLVATSQQPPTDCRHG